MKITKNLLRTIIIEELEEAVDSFGQGEESLEFLATKFNVMEDQAPDFLRKMAAKLEGE